MVKGAALRALSCRGSRVRILALAFSIMIPVSHALSGFIVLLPLVQTGVVEPSSFNIFLAVFFSVLPDIDGLWNPSLEEHHASLLHAPVFWIVLSSVFFVANLYNAAVLMLVSTLFHLFSDYLTALTTGVRLFYPFSEKDFHLFSLNSEPDGNFNPSNPSKNQLNEFLGLYLNQKPVLVLEAAMTVTGILCLSLL